MTVMKRFMDWYQGNNDREKEPPRGGIKRVGYVIWNYPGKLILINLLFILCCIPVFTIPAALTALNRYVIKIFRDGYNFYLADYFEEFKGSILRTLPLGILTGAMGFYAYYLLSLANNFGEETIGHNMLTGIGFGVLMISILAGSYFFLQTAMLELPLKSILRNTLILIIVEWKKSLCLTFTILSYWGILLGCAPYSLILVLSFGFALQQLLVCVWLNPVIDRRILEPFEKQKAKGLTV